MTELVQKSILDSGDFLPLEQIALRFGLSSAELKSMLDAWEAEGRIFSVAHTGCVLFPSYAFQDGAECMPAPALMPILTVLRATKNSWGIAYWFASINVYIGSRRPQDVLFSVGDQLMLAAKYEVAGVTHG